MQIVGFPMCWLNCFLVMTSLSSGRGRINVKNVAMFKNNVQECTASFILDSKMILLFVKFFIHWILLQQSETTSGH